MENSYRNLRDLGGLECRDGRKIKNGMIFRAPYLMSDSPTDIDYLNRLGPDAVVDLRCEEEIRERPDPEIKNCRYVAAPVFDGGKYKYIVVTNRAKLRCVLLHGKRKNGLKQNKLDSYEEMPFSGAYNRIFECMDRGEKFLFHCTEGKDRTGIAAALIELALGRDRHGITEQYMLSEAVRPKKNREWIKYLGVSRQIIEDIAYCESTHTELLLLAENAVLKKYPDLEAYLLNEFNITEERREKWREIYLEKE